MSKGEQAAFPMARVLAVAECGTHAIFAAKVGTYAESEASIAAELLPEAVGPGMLLMADRGFFSYALWRRTIATGVDLLWRIRTDSSGPKPKPEHVEDLGDGTWLAHLRRKAPTAERNAVPMLVRVFDYTLDDGRAAGRDGADPVGYRLFSTLLDPREAPADELAAAYTKRSEIENAFDELRTHQRGPRVVLRSKSPDLVLQEIWGHLCCHFAIRSLMFQTAEHAGHDPDRISFTAALRTTRQTIAQQGDFPLAE